MYALGHFGRLLAPVDPQVLDRIVSNGASHISLTPRPMDPALPGLRRAYPNADDDERLLRYIFPGDEVDKMKAAGPLRVEVPSGSPVARLLEALAQRPQVRSLQLHKRDARFSFTRTTH